MPDSHPDVDFSVTGPGDAVTMYCATSAEASATAIARSIGKGGEPVTLDVLVSSEAGARWYGGDHGVEVYKEDPDASVHDRIRIRAESEGRVA